MNLFKRNKNKCEQCNEKFETHEELIHHARHIHHHPIVKCTGCDKEFIHEKDRLHHSRKEHQDMLHERSYRESHPEERGTPQERVDRHTSHFDDKL